MSSKRGAVWIWILVIIIILLIIGAGIFFWIYIPGGTTIRLQNDNQIIEESNCGFQFNTTEIKNECWLITENCKQSFDARYTLEGSTRRVAKVNINIYDTQVSNSKFVSDIKASFEGNKDILKTEELSIEGNNLYRVEEGDTYLEAISYLWYNGNKMIVVGFDEWSLNYIENYELKKNIAREDKENCLVKAYLSKYPSNLKF